MIVIFSTGDFGKNLRKARLEKGMPRRALASKTGCGWQFLRDVECGTQREVEFRLLMRLCNGVEQPLEVLSPPADKDFI